MLLILLILYHLIKENEVSEKLKNLCLPNDVIEMLVPPLKQLGYTIIQEDPLRVGSDIRKITTIKDSKWSCRCARIPDDVLSSYSFQNIAALNMLILFLSKVKLFIFSKECNPNYDVFIFPRWKEGQQIIVKFISLAYVSELKIKCKEAEKEKSKEKEKEILEFVQAMFEVETRDLSPKYPQKGLSVEKGETMMTENYVDFDLHIATNGHTIASSTEGEAVSDISTELPNDIQLALTLIERRQTNLGLLKKVGQSLYSWLFPGPIHTHFQQTEAAARTGKAKLRLRLRIEANTIASLPLEFLYRTMGGYYLSLNPDTVLSRYLNLPLPPGRVRHREDPLHMLAIVADPTDQTRLDPDEWEGIIKRALAEPRAEQMTLQTVKRATRKEIRNAY